MEVRLGSWLRSGVPLWTNVWREEMSLQEAYSGCVLGHFREAV